MSRPHLPALGLALVLLAPVLGFAQVPTFEDLPFGTGLELDLYLAPNEGPNPVLVLCHGGSYLTGDKREFRRLGHSLALAGISVVAINYHLGTVPDAGTETEAISMVYRDVLDAFAFLRSHAQQYQFDLDRVFIGGGSSGGHMSIATGVLYAREEHPAVHLRGVVGMYGGYFTENIDAHSTPLMILQGTDDRACLPEASRYMASLYRDAGAWCRFVLVEGMIHDWGGSRYYEKLLDQIVTFVLPPEGTPPAAEDLFLPLGTTGPI